MAERNAKSGHAVTLSDQAMILLRAIAAYEQVDDAAAVTMALATHATKIGAGPLARAALDEIERHGGSREYLGERVDGGAGGVDACPARCADDELHAVPEFRRSGENRFVLTPKAPEGAFADANDARSGLRPKADIRSGGP